MMTTTFLLSTLTSLLRFTLDFRLRVTAVERLHQGHGIYFGLTRGGNHVFAVARNLDIHKNIQDPAEAINNILVFPWPWRGERWQSFTIPGTTDLHQVRFHDGLLWLVNGRHPELLAIAPGSRAVVGQVPLARLVPPDLEHEPPADHAEDCYHFNSLHFASDRLFVLAHNWDRGSFVMEFAYEDAPSFLQRPELLRVHRGLGAQSHNILTDGSTLYVLDSAHGRLVTSDGRACDLSGASDQRSYLRGLAVNHRFLFVAHGYYSDDRAGRLCCPCFVSVLERETLRVVEQLEVGPHGNPCELLLLQSSA